jgi:hypothetical protein
MSEFEFILSIARELSKESLGREEVADYNGWDWWRGFWVWRR